jgi:hypothetical protein
LASPTPPSKNGEENRIARPTNTGSASLSFSDSIWRQPTPQALLDGNVLGICNHTKADKKAKPASAGLGVQPVPPQRENFLMALAGDYDGAQQS